MQSKNKKLALLITIVAVAIIGTVVYYLVFVKTAQKRVVDELIQYQSNQACTKDLVPLVHANGAKTSGSSSCLPDGWSRAR